MLRKMMYRKIIVSTSLLLVILMLYLIPSNTKEIEIENKTLKEIQDIIKFIDYLDLDNTLFRKEI